MYTYMLATNHKDIDNCIFTISLTRSSLAQHENSNQNRSFSRAARGSGNTWRWGSFEAHCSCHKRQGNPYKWVRGHANWIGQRMGQDPLVVAAAREKQRRRGARPRLRLQLGLGLGWAYAKQRDNFICRRCSGNSGSCSVLCGEGEQGGWLRHVATYELRLSNAVKCVKNGRKNQQTIITDSKSNRWRCQGGGGQKVKEGRACAHAQP